MKPLYLPLLQVRPMPMKAAFIRLAVPANVVGAYILYQEQQEFLRPLYAGRSDTDLRRRLLRHPIRGADSFIPIPCSTPHEAYLAELFAYRLLNPPYNNITPASNN